MRKLTDKEVEEKIKNGADSSNKRLISIEVDDEETFKLSNQVALRNVINDVGYTLEERTKIVEKMSEISDIIGKALNRSFSDFVEKEMMKGEK